MITINPLLNFRQDAKHWFLKINAVLLGPLENIVPVLDEAQNSKLKPQSLNTLVYQVQRKVRDQIGFRYPTDLYLKNDIDSFFKHWITKKKRFVRKPAPTQEELEYLIDTTGPKASCFYEFYFETGIRVTESCWIKKSEVYTNGNEYAIHVSHGKFGHERIVPVTQRLIYRIEDIFRGNKYLFETDRKTQYDRKKVYGLLWAESKPRIGRPVGPHITRHATATHLVGNHPNKLVAICDAMGWATINMALVYTHQSLGTEHFPQIRHQARYAGRNALRLVSKNDSLSI